MSRRTQQALYSACMRCKTLLCTVACAIVLTACSIVECFSSLLLPTAYAAVPFGDKNVQQRCRNWDLDVIDKLGHLNHLQASAPCIFNHFKPLAEKGDPFAQVLLGNLYENGIGVVQDCTQAIKWYRAAAMQNDAAGQCKLGMLYALGYGVDQQMQLAVYWITQAATHGFHFAQGLMAEFYFTGNVIVTKNYATAAAWCKKAAAQGVDLSQYRLGEMYANGLGVPQDHRLALQWDRKAAERGNSKAQYRIGTLYLHGRSVKRSRALALFWYAKAAEQGHTQAKQQLEKLLGAQERTRT